MFGFGELAAISAVISTLKSLNDSLATIKETGAHAGQFAGLISKYSDVDQKIRECEEKNAGVMDLKTSMQLQVAKRQADSFHQALKDSLLIQQGGAQQYREIMTRIEESKIAHEKRIKRIKKERAERMKLFKEVGQWLAIGLTSVFTVCSGLYLWVKFFR